MKSVGFAIPGLGFQVQGRVWYMLAWHLCVLLVSQYMLLVAMLVGSGMDGMAPTTDGTTSL